MTAEKDVQVARKKGRWEGGEVIRAMPERKHSFFRRCSLMSMSASSEDSYQLTPWSKDARDMRPAAYSKPQVNIAITVFTSVAN